MKELRKIDSAGGIRKGKSDRLEEEERKRNRKISKNIATCYESMPGNEAGMNLY